MINIRTLRKIQDNGGLTLKDGNIINYKSGYQVGIESIIETSDISEAMKAIRQCKKGTCGIWFSDGIWYIDRSIRINSKSSAVVMGLLFEQQSIFAWRNKNKKVIFIQD